MENFAVRLTRFITLALLGMAACAYGQDVHYNYDRDVKFASYKTYQWINLPGAVGDQLIDRDIKRSIDEQLARKGLTRVNENANLYVGYEAAIDLEKSVDLRSTGLGGVVGLGDRALQGQTSTIPVGMLLVSLYDPGKSRLIWRGDASKAIDVKKDPDKNYKSLQKAVAKLFKNYPPQAGR
jgi:Domain of unknown function (DUF4136)